MIEFYDQLNVLNEYVQNNKGNTNLAISIQDDINKLNDEATKYLMNNRITEFSNFKDSARDILGNMEQHANKSSELKVILSNIALMIVGGGVLYLIAAGVQLATTGDFLFRSNSQKMTYKIDNIEKSLSISEKISKDLISKPLSVNVPS